MLVLGLSGGLNHTHEDIYPVAEGYYHDAAAALIQDGHVIAAFEEERLNRIKHTNKLPVLAAKACMRLCGVSADQIDYFAFSASEELLQFMLTDRYKDNGFTVYSFLQQLLENEFGVAIDSRKIKFVDHHLAHAATAFYPSKFEKSLVITIDGSDGRFSGSVYDGNNNDLKFIRSFSAEDQSLGNFYSKVTYRLGFGYFDEYKVMGLASYGDPKTYRKIFNRFYSLLPSGDYKLHMHNLYMLDDILQKQDIAAGPARSSMDIAASLQEMLERIVFHIVKYYQKTTQHVNLCMAGGVALNCTLNGKLLKSGLFEDIFVYPAANDSGLPVGTALTTWFTNSTVSNRIELDHLYLGSTLGDKDCIVKELHHWKDLVRFIRTEDPSLKAAELLANGKVLGWCQGRSEFAPRALGNRSILADPRPVENRMRINAIIKKREEFRPFAPSVLEECAQQFFELPGGMSKFPYMMFTFKVKKKYRKLLGAVTHTDGSARVQTVSKEINPGYWKLINDFKEITGTPAVLNTSFNNRVEPIVDSITDALVCFLTTDLDYLFIGDYLVEKKGVLMEQLPRLFISLPPYIRLNKHEVYTQLTEPGLSVSFTVTNSFNEKRINISGNMFDILIRSDGKETIESFMSGQGISCLEQRARLTKEFMHLWNERVIILLPIQKL